VVLGSGRFVLAVVLLCLSQKLCQSRDIHAAESSSGKPRLDLICVLLIVTSGYAKGCSYKAQIVHQTLVSVSGDIRSLLPELSEQRRYELRNRRMDVHRSLEDGVRSFRIHRIQHAMDHFVAAGAEHGSTQDVL
jgi:hypothetical protein